MMSKASLDRELTQYLEKKYNKVFLTSYEVEHETLVTATNVPSTSDKPHTWLLRDVVEFINKPFYSKEFNKMDKKVKKAFVIQNTTQTLNKVWRSIHNERRRAG